MARKLHSHPVVQLYIPDTLLTQVKQLQLKYEFLKIELIGLTERVQHLPPSLSSSFDETEDIDIDDIAEDNEEEDGDHLLDYNSNSNDCESCGVGAEIQAVIVNIIGLRVSNVKVQGQFPYEGQDVGFFNEDNGLVPEVVGNVLIATGSDQLHPLATNIPSIWLTLRIPPDFNSFIVEMINLDSVLLCPDPDSLFVMRYDSKILKYAYLLGLKKSGLPSAVIQGFGCKNSDLGLSQIIPCVLTNDEKVLDPEGDYERGYFTHFIERDEDYPNSGGNDISLRNKVLNRCVGVRQLFYKCHLMVQMLSGRLSNLAVANLIAMIMIDTILGLLLTRYLTQFPNLYSILHSKVEELLTILLRLLNWLRGSPAGLKLNTALNSLLWRFFSYHLHLWANYIGILEPILSIILTLVISIGPLGLTLQVSLIKDLLSLATFHVYCLYIYATRLFRVLLIAIKSLGRLFLGRKWNPLRNRVDHVTLSMSEMFLSALAFTIGIFLAPTIMIYYIVFLLLRIPVFIIESILVYFVQIFNNLRAITAFLIFVNFPRLCDEIYLTPLGIKVKGQRSNSNLTFRINLQSIKSIITVPKIGPALGYVLKCIFQGKVLK